LDLKPESDAYNNIGIGYFYLLNFMTGHRGLQRHWLKPSYQLAKNNLENAMDKKKSTANATTIYPIRKYQIK